MAIDVPEELTDAYLEFFRNFQTDGGEFKYISFINKMIREGKRSLTIYYDDLVLMDDEYDLEISSTLTENPVFAIQIGSAALAEQVRLENPDYYREVTYDGQDQFKVRFANTPTPIQIRDIRASHVDSIRWLEGIIIRATEIKTIITDAVFYCIEKQHTVRMKFQDGIFAKPNQCSDPTCRAKEFTLDPNESKMIDWQIITLQEKPEDLPPGASPKSLGCRLVDDIVNSVRPGDRVHIGGIVRTKPTKMVKRGQILTYDVWVDVNFIESLTRDDQYAEITLEDEIFFKNLAQDPKIHDRLLESIAPAIHGLTRVKEAALLMLFGGVEKVFPDGFTVRGQSNVLLVGDPGTAKSQILKYVKGIAPRGLYTSGRGSSAAGLTAAIIRDPDTGEITLEAGAMVLADQGLCLIDEFDKMSETDRSAIHEAMEQHSYHPSTELRLSDGKLVNMGDFVEDLFDKYPESFAKGIDCEILSLDDIPNSILSTNFIEINQTRINRVSRHIAPEKFYRITYSNGRSIFVTPEHPIYQYDDNGISVVDADKIKVGAFVPAVRSMQFASSELKQFNVDFQSGRKELSLPHQLTEEFASFLGYYISKGYSYKGSTFEVGLSNTDPIIIRKMIDSIMESFSVHPINDTENNRTIRIVSRDVYEFLHYNFPSLMLKSYQKRIPDCIFSSSREQIIAFLSSAFEGDGRIESENLCYNTTSRGLAGDYQDILSIVNIQTRIIEDEYDYDNHTRSRIGYKIYIRGHCLNEFVQNIIPQLKNNPSIKFLINRSSRGNHSRDVLPGNVAGIIKQCYKDLGLTYNGELWRAETQDHGITFQLIKRIVFQLKYRISSIQKKLHGTFELKPLCEMVGYSENQAAQLISLKRATFEYQERGTSQSHLQSLFKMGIDIRLSEVEEKILYLENLMSFQWVRVKKIEILPNKKEFHTDWVYDVTIEPNHNFISNNLVLHNTVSIAKAGIVATLNSRTAVFAAANPKYGRYEPNRSFSENVNLTPAILSRFDIVFIIRDEPEEKKDTVLASHILNLHRFHGTSQSVIPPLTEEQLKKYIAYAKTHYNPTLTEEAAEVISEFYVNMRNSYGKSGEDGNRKNRITITARQLEGIIRLAEARARSALRNIVSKHDALMAIELMKESLSQIAIDPATGEVDIDSFYSGHTSSKRTKLTKLLSIMDFLYRDAGGKPFDEDWLIEEAEREGITKEYTKGVIQQMLRDGSLYQPRPGKLKRPDT